MNLTLITRQLFDCTKSKIKPYICKSCPNFKTYHMSYFKQHLNEAYTQENPIGLLYNCIKCSFTTYSKYLALRHAFFANCAPKVNADNNMNVDLSTEQNFCCNYECIQKDGLNIVIKHTQGLLDQCENCRKKSFQKEQLDDNKNKIINTNCTYKSIQKEKDLHIRHTPKNNLQKAKFKKRYKQWFHCEHCTYKSVQKGNLKQHILVKHSVENLRKRLYECEFCNHRAFEKGQLKQHVERKHPQNGQIKWLKKEKFGQQEYYLPEWFQCAHCSYKSLDKNYLRRHLLRHIRKIRRKDLKKRHQENNERKIDKPEVKNTPTTSQLFCCPHCRYKFTQKGNLKQHILVKHTLESRKRLFQCQFCNHIAYEKGQLKQHVKAKHDKKNWFRCDQCSYKAAQKFSLITHIKAKHLPNEAVEWFQCADCDFKSIWKGVLKKHILKNLCY